MLLSSLSLCSFFFVTVSSTYTTLASIILTPNKCQTDLYQELNTTVKVTLFYQFRHMLAEKWFESMQKRVF